MKLNTFHICYAYLGRNQNIFRPSLKNPLCIIIVILSIGIFISNCGKKSNPPIKFKEVSYLDTYKLNIPEIIYQEGAGIWKTMSHNSTFLFFGLSELSKNEQSIEANLQEFILKDSLEGFQEFELISKRPISFSDFNGFVYYYKKGSPTTIQVYTYLVYAVIENKNNMLGAKSIYFGKDYTEEIDSTIQSIQFNYEFETETNLIESPEQITSYVKQGYKYFKSHKILVKCPCELRPNKDVSIEKVLSDSKNPIWAFACADSETNTKFKLNVTDISAECETYPESISKHCERYYLDSFVQEFKNSKINVTRGKIHNVSKIEFSFKNDLKSRTMVFVKNKKVYFLHAESEPQVTAQFNTFISSLLFTK